MSQTHWRKLHNPDFLGAYAIDPGKDLVVTIKSVSEENIVGADGKKEDCMVMRFMENIKPMIVNSTNAKTITKLLKTPYIEEWAGKRIQIFVDNVRAFGETVEALRVRPFLPKIKESEIPKCGDCGSDIDGLEGKMNPAQLAQYTQRKYGKSLCSKCAAKIGAEKTETDSIEQNQSETDQPEPGDAE